MQATCMPTTWLMPGGKVQVCTHAPLTDATCYFITQKKMEALSVAISNGWEEFLKPLLFAPNVLNPNGLNHIYYFKNADVISFLGLNFCVLFHACTNVRMQP